MTRCPVCGGDDLVLVTRDADPLPDGTPPPRHAYGEWIVCETCGHEWPAEEEHDTDDERRTT